MVYTGLPSMLNGGELELEQGMDSLEPNTFWVLPASELFLPAGGSSAYLMTSLEPGGVLKSIQLFFGIDGRAH